MSLTTTDLNAIRQIVKDETLDIVQTETPYVVREEIGKEVAPIAARSYMMRESLDSLERDFTKLYARMEKGLETINTKLDNTATKSQFDTLSGSIDGFVNRIETVEIEQLSSDRQQDRLKKWAHRVAKEVEIPLVQP